MKRGSESAIFFAAVFAVAGLLSGCADTEWPSWLTGEPDRSVLESQRVVGRAYDSDDIVGWPNLADVPAMPDAGAEIKEGKVQIRKLGKDRVEAKKIRKRVEEGQDIVSSPLTIDPHDYGKGKNQ